MCVAGRSALSKSRVRVAMSTYPYFWQLTFAGLLYRTPLHKARTSSSTFKETHMRAHIVRTLTYAHLRDAEEKERNMHILHCIPRPRLCLASITAQHVNL